jgi:hypothetical protein
MFVPARNKTRLIHGSHSVEQRLEQRLTAEMLLSRRFHKIFSDAYVARDVPTTAASMRRTRDSG